MARPAPGERQSDSEPEPLAAPAAQAKVTPQQAAVLRLQRSAGNAATVAVLARWPPSAGPEVEDLPNAMRQHRLDAMQARAEGVHQFSGAVQEHRWRDALQQLGQLDAATRHDQIAGASADTLAHLFHDSSGGLRSELDAALRTNPAAAQALVGVIQAASQAALGRHDWLNAAREVRGLGQSDLTRVLGGYTLEQLQGLTSITTGLNRGTFGYIASSVAAALVARINSDFDAAVGRRDAAAALRLADLLDETGMRAAIQRAAAAGFAGPMATASPGIFRDEAHRVRRTLRYLLHPADFGAAARPLGMGGGSGGNASRRTAVPGGQVWVMTDVTLGTQDDAFSCHYEDTGGSGQARNTGWIQFIALEIESFNATDEHLEWYSGTAEATGQPTPIPFSRPSDRRWQLDSLSDPRPFYEGGGASNMTTVSTEMTDRPGDDWNLAAGMFSRSGFAMVYGDSVVKVVERTTFDDYLVRGQDILFKITIECEDTWTHRPTGELQSVRRTRELSRGPASAMTRQQWDALRARAPSYAVYPTR